MKNVMIFLVAFAMLFAGCASMSNQGKGTAIGAGVGAALGAIIFKNNAAGALIGAAIGGTAGNLIGKKMDRQAEALKQALPDAQVERVGEGINVTFDSELLFEKGKSKLSDEGKSAISKISKVLSEYPDTYILVEGHTSADPKLASKANEEANLKLSKDRADAVGLLMKKSGITDERVVEKWHGGALPKFPNDSPENMAKNRRVEVAIIANEKMQEDAKAGNLQ
jgi:outer membrane protein OmpA-like peptidoglycan-associated protein